MKHVTSLISEALSVGNVKLSEVAPGIYVLSRRECQAGPMTFKVSWDPERWKLGAKNPKKCFLQVSFENFTGEDVDNGNTLIGFLKNVLTPYQKGLEFFSAAKALKITSIDFERYKPCIN